MTWSEPANTDDVIDSRQVIERIDLLRSDLEDLRERLAVLPANLAMSREALSAEIDEEQAELAILEKVNDAGESLSSDWTCGETMVRDDYFEDYARDLAIDCAGSREESDFLAGRAGGSWPMNHVTIDWEAAADELQSGDYSEVDFNGVTYWVRHY